MRCGRISRGCYRTNCSRRIASLTARDGRLVVYVESAARTPRLRYALAEHWPAVQYAQPELPRVGRRRFSQQAAGAGARTSEVGALSRRVEHDLLPMRWCRREQGAQQAIVEAVARFAGR
jgi:hypothetical protein